MPPRLPALLGCVMSRRPPDPDYLERFRVRVLQDALAEAEAATWDRRAETFEAARPRPDDFTGLATPDELLAREARLTAVARACRARAALIRLERAS